MTSYGCGMMAMEVGLTFANRMAETRPVNKSPSIARLQHLLSLDEQRAPVRVMSPTFQPVSFLSEFRTNLLELIDACLISNWLTGRTCEVPRSRGHIRVAQHTLSGALPAHIRRHEQPWQSCGSVSSTRGGHISTEEARHRLFSCRGRLRQDSPA